MTYDLGGHFDQVDSDDHVYRRGWPHKKFMNPDGSAPSRTFALRPQDNGKLSVDVASMCTENEAVTQRGKHELGKFWLYQVSVEFLLSLGLLVYNDPLTFIPHGEDNPSHAFVWGLDEEDEVLPGKIARKAHRVGA